MKIELYKDFLEQFVTGSRDVLGHNLTGIYMHGSAVMGCFQPGKSDIDLLLVVKEDISDKAKRQFMDMVVELNKQAPAKGLELSIVKEHVCKPFVYPTPFELHFSMAHLVWYQSNPQDYIEKMKGTDKDLAAHFTITYHRGQVLYGEEISEVFAPVPKEDYLDSIWYDIENAAEEISENPMYLTLNLCRVLAYVKEGLITSKQEGGEWGLKYTNRPEFQVLITAALQEYQSNVPMVFEAAVAKEFAEYMLGEIKEMKENYLIRKVMPGDEAVLAYIQTESWKAAFKDILTEDELVRCTNLERATGMYAGLMEAKKGNGYLLEVEGKGHCIAWWDATRENDMEGFAELICIHSLQDNWRKGYGSKMMDKVLADMSDAGYTKVMLWVFEENKRARNFYEAKGFVKSEKSKTIKGVTEVMYQKEW